LLAAVDDYLALWQLPIGLGLFACWALGGAYLIHRAVRADLSRRKGALSRCVLVSVLATIAGAVAGAILLFLIDTIGEQSHLELRWPALLLAVAAFLIVTFVVLTVAFDLPLGRLLRTAAVAYAPGAVLAIAVATPTAWYAYQARQHSIAREHSLATLRFLYQRIRYDYVRRIREPPATLEQLVTDKLIRPQVLQCRRNRGRAVDYFYVASPLTTAEQPRRILACDFIDNHNGAGRGVLFSDGVAEWYPAEALPKLLGLLENHAFAKGLQAAEAAMPKP